MRRITWMCCALAMLAAPALGAEIWVQWGMQLQTFDSANPSVLTPVGPMNIVFNGMDFTVGGQLFGVDNDYLYSVDTATGLTTLVGGLNLTDGHVALDMSWDPVTQEMYILTAVDFATPPRLYTLDLTTGAPTLVGELNLPPFGFVSTLATSSAGVRYVCHSGSQGQYSLDGLNGTFLGPEGWSFALFDGSTMDWSRDDAFFHAGWNQTTERSELWQVDPLTGAGTFLGPVGPNGESLFLDIAIRPVPEPATLLALSLLALAVRRR